MYAFYSKQALQDGLKYEFIEKTSLYGCNVGWIPQALRRRLTGGEERPHNWHLSVQRELAEAGREGQAVLIDFTPRRQETLLCELQDIWGHSRHWWTPMMMRLAVLLLDVDRSEVDCTCFPVERPGDCETVYSISYVNGGIEDGHLAGRWTPGGASATNSAVLWPNALAYFIRCIKESSPEIIAAAVG